MTRQAPQRVDPEWYLLGGASKGVVAQNYSRMGINLSSRAIAASGVMHTSTIFLEEGAVVGTIGYCVGTTASSGLTAGFVALYDTAGALMSQSGAITTTRSASTAFSHALARPCEITSSGIYRIGMSFTVSTTMPTMQGITLTTSALVDAFGQPNIFQTSGSALGSVAPATIGSVTRISTGPWYLLT
jgi:hypothetical protein